MPDKKAEQKKRGFAAMSPERHHELAKLGGLSVPAASRAFSVNHDLAVAAGKKGGKSVNDAKRPFSTDRLLASRAGRKGGIKSAAKNGKQTRGEG